MRFKKSLIFLFMISFSAWAKTCEEEEMPIFFGYFPNDNAIKRSFTPMPIKFNEYTGRYDSFWVKTSRKGNAEFKILSHKKIFLNGDLELDKDGLTIRKPSRSAWLSKLFVELINKNATEVSIQITIDKKTCTQSMILETGD